MAARLIPGDNPMADARIWGKEAGGGGLRWLEMGRLGEGVCPSRECAVRDPRL